jgi:2-polyprenyl-6-methoxyphenol hydroxylase-like FAD-dependent oxidoreductase
MASIVIIGGGIGGLALAGCLRARGIESVVYERAAELREVGAALGLWPNATRVLRRLGVLEGLVARSHVPPMGVLRDWRGRVLVKMAALESEVPTVFAHRAEVHRALLAAVPAERVQLNRVCTGVERREGKVRAAFGDRSFTEWAEGLVGADGIRSVVREQTLQDGAPRYRGYVAWRGVAEFAPEGEEIVGESWGPGQRFGFIPLGCGRVGWWATANKRGEEGRRTCADSQSAWRNELRQRFAGWHAPIELLLEATPESAVLCNAIMDRAPVKPGAPGAGPVTLLGDAAHPMTPNLGQGACAAIEDAAVLARMLATMPEATATFRAYERARYERTAMLVRESAKMGSMGQWENGLACAVRNFLVRHMPEGGMRKQFRELWSYDAWGE